MTSTQSNGAKSCASLLDLAKLDCTWSLIFISASFAAKLLQDSCSSITNVKQLHFIYLISVNSEEWASPLLKHYFVISKIANLPAGFETQNLLLGGRHRYTWYKITGAVYWTVGITPVKYLLPHLNDSIKTT